MLLIFLVHYLLNLFKYLCSKVNGNFAMHSLLRSYLFINVFLDMDMIIKIIISYDIPQTLHFLIIINP